MTPNTANGERPRLRLVEFRPLRKNALRGFATVELPIGLTIVDCPVCSSHGKSWVGLPSRPQLDRDGWPVMRGNKLQYVSVLRWRDHDLGNRFSAAVLDLIRAEHPGALDDEEAEGRPAHMRRTPS